MRYSIAVIIVLAASSALAGTAKISGTVVDQNGAPVPHFTVELASSEGGWMGGIPQALTDDQGHFSKTVVNGYAWDGSPYGHHWAVSPYDEKNYYPRLTHFYETADNQPAQVELPSENSEGHVVVKLGPKAGAITGHVTDALSGSILMPYFEFERVADPSRRMGIRMGDPFRILLPSNTEVKFVVQMEGYKPWTYPGTISVGPGQDLTLDIKLEPLSKTTNAPANGSQSPK